MAATGQISSTPSVFNFLKEGLLLPTHNRRLFATIFTIIVASSCLLRLGNNLAVQPLRDEIHLETKALNSTDPSSPADNLQLTQKTLDVTWALLLTRLFDVNVIIKSAIQIVVLFAAITTYSGELHTFGSLLGKIKTHLKGPMLTLAILHTLEVASVELLGAMIRLFMSIKYLGLSIVVSLFVVLPFSFIFFMYFNFLCPLSVVVAVGERHWCSWARVAAGEGEARTGHAFHFCDCRAQRCLDPCLLAGQAHGSRIVPGVSVQHLDVRRAAV